MSKQSIIFSKSAKDFLDKDSKFSSQEFGSVCWNVSIEKWEGKDLETPTFYASHSLRLSDCNRSISLDMSADTPEEYDMRLHKVDELIGNLEALKSALLEAKQYIMINGIETK